MWWDVAFDNAEKGIKYKEKKGSIVWFITRLKKKSFRLSMPRLRKSRARVQSLFFSLFVVFLYAVVANHSSYGRESRTVSWQTRYHQQQRNVATKSYDIMPTKTNEKISSVFMIYPISHCCKYYRGSEQNRDSDSRKRNVGGMYVWGRSRRGSCSFEARIALVHIPGAYLCAYVQKTKLRLKKNKVQEPKCTNQILQINIVTLLSCYAHFWIR